jgi:pimeloyl-ACP methyl ester carboxylesterase
LKRKLLVLIGLGLVVTSFGQNALVKPKLCDFLKPEKSEGVSCGFVEVPENHDHTKGKRIKIAYAVLKAKGKSKKEIPVILLNGGPGGQALIGIERWIDSPLRQERDLIVFDQRGIGFSSELPNPDVGIFKILAGNFTIQEENRLIRDTLEVYHKKCIEKNIDLSCYITSQNAADVNALMESLGYEKYALYGESYGTRVAREVMERFPERVDCAIIDAPAILESDFLSLRIKNYNDGLEKIFSYCENDLACKSKYPTLRKDYFDAVKALEMNPLQLTIGEKPFYVNPQDALFLLRYQLYAPTSKTIVPAFIQALKDRDIKSLNESQQFILGFVSSLNLSMFISVERNEEYNANQTPVNIDKLYATLPNLPAKLGFFTSLYQSANNWHTKTMTADEKKLKKCEQI